MSGAREEVLARVRGALADVPADERPGDVAVPRDYHRGQGASRVELATLFERRVREYGADVRRVPAGSVGEAVEQVCHDRSLSLLAVPPGVPGAWRPSDVRLLDDDRLTTAELDTVDGALTGCAAAIAQTGTIALDGGELCGRRPTTLIPDHHICVVPIERLRSTVPEAISDLAEAAARRLEPITLISGPSATSDIELQRVEGVHGPRNLIVLIVDGEGV